VFIVLSYFLQFYLEITLGIIIKETFCELFGTTKLHVMFIFDMACIVHYYTIIITRKEMDNMETIVPFILKEIEVDGLHSPIEISLV
jgi:hypothetical protein